MLVRKTQKRSNSSPLRIEQSWDEFNAQNSGQFGFCEARHGEAKKKKAIIPFSMIAEYDGLMTD